MPFESDYYTVLDISSEATVAEIKRAYRARARAYHPDLGGSSDEMRLINEAYHVLANRKKRAEYDQKRNMSVGGHSTVLPGNRPGPDVPSGTLVTNAQKLVVRAALCFLLGITCLGFAEEAFLVKHAVHAWWLRILGMAVVTLGGVLGYRAHRLVGARRTQGGSSVVLSTHKAYARLFLGALIVVVASWIIIAFFAV